MRGRVSGIFAGLVVAVLVAAALYFQFQPWGNEPEGPSYTVSQMGRKFAPNTIRIERGATVTIVNDDGQLIHHAYVKSKKLNFDSGEQEPGSRTKIYFPATGTFEVLCAIHPKMKLTVDVE